MSDDILSQQYIDGRRYSSPMLEKMGGRLLVYDPRKNYSTQPPSLPAVSKPKQNYEGDGKFMATHTYTTPQPVEQRQRTTRIVATPQPVEQRQRTARTAPRPEISPQRRSEPRQRAPEKREKVALDSTVFVYIFIIVAVLIVAFLALNWRMQPNATLKIGPGPDSSIETYLAEYAGLGPEEEFVDPDFPLEITQIFSAKPYTVVRGDTVSGIANRFNLSMDAVITLNGISNARMLQEGKVLKIPNMDGIPYTVRAGDTYQKIADNFNAPLNVILDANDIQNDIMNPGDTLFIPGAHMRSDALKLALGDYFMWPLKERSITSPYGWRRDPFTGIGGRVHEGIDFSAKTGTTIRAAMDGKITKLGYNAVYGKYIIISHGNGFETLYGHLNAYSVKEGAFVYQGTKIAESGGTGHVTGPHLHFGVYKNGKSVNPLDYLAK
ncbi:MAG: peptidoglycan DD-metalloendopeptidase family protein [Treponema sp.]|jgi:murein DD-endopeptidase MepM/ murein hydrolase activator NlpD|nr:peptidoglycan DD-metalloendopeptidase family protein [Treponema sp.]